MSQPDIYAALSGIDIGRIDSIERIKHGLTNDSWLVRSTAGEYVVRRSNSSEESLQINRQSEKVILETVARAGIGPEVIRCDPTGHLLVTRYAGQTWSDERISDPANIERIAVLLRRLHAITPPPAIQQVDLANVVHLYLQTLEEHGQAPKAAHSRRLRATQATAVLRAQPELRLCHNDIHALNIVGNGELRLIDWEYAGLGERFFDLASICVYHDFSKSQREQLLSAYLDTANPQAWHRLELCRWLFDFIRELWTAVRELKD